MCYVFRDRHSSAKPDGICGEMCCPSMLLVVFVLIQSNNDVSTLFLLIPSNRLDHFAYIYVCISLVIITISLNIYFTEREYGSDEGS